MRSQRKKPKIPGKLRLFVAENIRDRMTDTYKDSRNRTLALARDSGVAHSTVQRIIAAEVGASIDNLEAIAGALKMQTYQLLIPNERSMLSTAADYNHEKTTLHERRTRYHSRHGS